MLTLNGLWWQHQSWGESFGSGSYYNNTNDRYRSSRLKHALGLRLPVIKTMRMKTYIVQMQSEWLEDLSNKKAS